MSLIERIADFRPLGFLQRVRRGRFHAAGAPPPGLGAADSGGTDPSVEEVLARYHAELGPEMEKVIHRAINSGHVLLPDGSDALASVNWPANLDALTPQALTDRPYAFDYPIPYQVPHQPQRHPGALVSMPQERMMADVFDIPRACISHIQREARSRKPRFVPTDPNQAGPETQKQIEAARKLFGSEGPVGGPGKNAAHVTHVLIEDLLVIGCAACWVGYTRGGRVNEVLALDASTVRPRVDAYGQDPGDPYAYEQWIMGVPRRLYSHKDLLYTGMYPVSYMPYYRSPMEWCYLTCVRGLKADDWNASWLTDGTEGSAAYAIAGLTTTKQLAEFLDYYRKARAGNTAMRQVANFFPQGSQALVGPTRRDMDFEGYNLHLLRRCCAMYGVSPTAIGFMGEQYKVSQEASLEQTSTIGVVSVLTTVAEIFNRILRLCGLDRVELTYEVQSIGDREKQAVTDDLTTRSGVSTINEARARRGDGPLPGGDEPLVLGNLTTLAALHAAADAAKALAANGGVAPSAAGSTMTTGGAGAHGTGETGAKAIGGASDSNIGKTGGDPNPVRPPSTSDLARAANEETEPTRLEGQAVEHCLVCVGGNPRLAPDAGLVTAAERRLRWLRRRLATGETGAAPWGGILAADERACRDTATALGEALGLAVTTATGLRSWDAGFLRDEWEATGGDELVASLQYYMAVAPEDEPPGGESYARYLRRVREALELYGPVPLLVVAPIGAETGLGAGPEWAVAALRLGRGAFTIAPEAETRAGRLHWLAQWAEWERKALRRLAAGKDPSPPPEGLDLLATAETAATAQALAARRGGSEDAVRAVFARAVCGPSLEDEE